MSPSLRSLVRAGILAAAPICLFSQAATELGPLEFRPQQAAGRSAARRALSFERGVAAPAAYRLGAVRQEELDAVRPKPNVRLTGLERNLNRTARQIGQWTTLDDGRLVWRMAIQSEGAVGLRVQFSRFQVDNGAVWIYSEDHTQVFGPYTGSGIDDSGEFWSHTIYGDNAVVEYQPETEIRSTPFAVVRISHMLGEAQLMSAGSCELDVSCYADWKAVSSGVGLYIFQSGGASYACSGALINNSKNDSTPYFLTADHCISDATEAKTVEVYWNYETSACNGSAPGLSGLPRTLGATYLASKSINYGDFSLIRLSPLPTNVPLTFYGWNSSATAVAMGDTLVGIHHPKADFKRISFGVRDPDMAAQVGTEYAPSNMFYQVRETSGRIEPGSSGSPLFNSSKMIVGTLTYGPSGTACSISPFSAGYGRFSTAYPALAPYLSPTTSGGGGTTTPAATLTASPTSVKLNWTLNTSAPGTQTVQLLTNSTTALPLTAGATQSWIQLAATSLSATQAKPASLPFTINTLAFSAAGTYTGNITVTGASVSQTIAVQVTVAAAATAFKGGPVTLIPYFKDGGSVATTFMLVNPYATATNASISFVSGTGTALTVPVGTASVSWQNVTIPAYGSAAVTTTGASSPVKQGMALVQSNDATKKLQANALVGLDLLTGATAPSLPFVIPFDATGTPSATLYLFNNSITATSTLNLTIYDTNGAVVGTGQITVPPQQEGAIAMTKTAAVFGGRKGILYVSGSGSFLSMSIRTATDGSLSNVPPLAAGQ
jgi:hypothetical protein